MPSTFKGHMVLEDKWLNITAHASVMPRVRELKARGDVMSLVEARDLLLTTDPDAPGARELMMELYLAMCESFHGSKRSAA